MNAKEAFEDIKQSFANYLSKELGKPAKKCYEMLKNDTALDTIESAILRLESAEKELEDRRASQNKYIDEINNVVRLKGEAISRALKAEKELAELKTKYAWLEKGDGEKELSSINYYNDMKHYKHQFEKAEKELAIEKKQRLIAYENWQECEKELAEIKAKRTAPRKQTRIKLMQLDAVQRELAEIKARAEEWERVLSSFTESKTLGYDCRVMKRLIDFIIKGEGK